uniref:C-type lectin domain family 4 member K n=1 Tax=Pogona vitticeps TaxID=103695 RepID=A0A6J0TRG8_9SAUR
MAREISYENAEVFEPKEIALKKSSGKRTTFVLTFLALLALLLAIVLLALAVLYVQKERKLTELERAADKIKAALRLSNVSFASEDVQLLENISEAFSKLQAHLENVSASQTAAQDGYRRLLHLVSAGWKLYQGNFYLLFQEAKNWHAAEQDCQSSGAHLTSVTSRQEMDYLSKESGGLTFWIGLTDHEEEGNWTWADGTKYNRKISFWAREQPDNWHGAPEHQEDCVQIAKAQWNDVSCTYSYRGFCKMPFS